MACTVKIIGDFDGGNPKSPDGIIQTDGNAFTIFPFSEDNDPNYKFRFDIKIINYTDNPHPVELTIDWGELTFNHLRDYVYVRHPKDMFWNYHPMQIHRTRSCGTISVYPGETYACLHPKYNYQDYLEFVRRVPKTDFLNKEKIGETPEKREIWMIRISSRHFHESTPKRVLIVARIHPYETSGSYCIEGIVNDLIMSGRSKMSGSQKNFDLFLVPMANPDGVYNGYCKLSALNGLDISKHYDHSDGTARLLKQFIDDVRPDLYCELHNWMFKRTDGIYLLNYLGAKRFIRFMPNQEQYQKKWRPILRRKLVAGKAHGFKKYCRDQFGATSLVLEYPWYLRSTTAMKQLGASTFDALLHL
jgi:hypothetical protein